MRSFWQVEVSDRSRLVPALRGPRADVLGQHHVERQAAWALPRTLEPQSWCSTSPSTATTP